MVIFLRWNLQRSHISQPSLWPTRQRQRCRSKHESNRMNHHKTSIFITRKPTENHQNPTSNQQKLWDFEAPMELLDTTALSCKLCSWVAAWSTAASLLGIMGIFHPKWGYAISKDGNIMGISWKCQRFF